jgi:hypothetical protein
MGGNHLDIDIMGPSPSHILLKEGTIDQILYMGCIWNFEVAMGYLEVGVESIKINYL